MSLIKKASIFAEIQIFLNGLTDDLYSWTAAEFPGTPVTVRPRLIDKTDDEHDPHYTIRLSVTSPDGTIDIDVDRRLSSDGKLVEHAFFSINQSLQNKGISPYIQRKFLELYNTLGTEKIVTHANLDVGGYTWARYGFRPNYQQSESLISRMAMYDRRLQQQTGISEEVFNAWWDKLLAGPREDMQRFLLGSDWMGSIDLTDPRHRGAYEAYIRQVGAKSNLYKHVYGAEPAPGEVLDPASRIDALLSRAEPRLARIFRTSIDQLRASLNLEEVADMISTGRLEELLQRLQHAAEALGQESTALFISSGQSTAQFLASADVGQVLFNVVNTRAVRAAQENQMRLIRGFTQDQRAAVNVAIVDGTQRGVGPRQMAREFRQVVGLTERQSQAVANYRRLLGQQSSGEVTAPSAEALDRALKDGRFDGTVRRAIREARPLTQQQIDRMVDRYSERYVKYRAEVIGRTEALRTVHQGAEEAYAQAIDAGHILRDRLVNEWVSARDGRVRDSHRHLNGLVQPYGEVFHGLGGDLKYPGDPDAPASETVQCRCILTRRITSSKA